MWIVRVFFLERNLKVLGADDLSALTKKKGGNAIIRGHPKRRSLSTNTMKDQRNLGDVEADLVSARRLRKRRKVQGTTRCHPPVHHERGEGTPDIQHASLNHDVASPKENTKKREQE